MRIVIAGGTGFLGAPLAESYGEEGHDVRVLTRALPDGESSHDPGTGVPGITQVGWRPDGHAGPWARTVDGADAVVNLAGESLDQGRWTPQRKARLRDSRVIPTRSLVAAIQCATAPPRVFVSGSGAGYYGPSAEEIKTESDPAGHDFLSGICVEWEAEARRAEGASGQVVCLRAGVVLDRTGGALARMLLPFRLFAGGPLGSGRQYMSWIHRRDWIEMVRWIVETREATGPMNATAPVPVTNREFVRALGRALHRPAFTPAPSFALRLLFGEMADALLLKGQRAVPARATALGFHFKYPDIDQAMRGIFET